MTKDVDRDYKSMLLETDQYKEDAEYIDTLVSDFSSTSEELLSSIHNMIRVISEVTSATNEGAMGTSNIVQKTFTIMEKVGEVTTGNTSTKIGADKLKDMVSRFKT